LCGVAPTAVAPPTVIAVAATSPVRNLRETICPPPVV
jgi:hypothetical protein